MIVVTGSLSDEPAADYIKAGAADYVLKSNLRRLPPAVRRALDLRRAREEQARAREALQHSETKYRALIDQAADAILIADPSGHLIDANRKACDLTGYALDELLQRDMADTYPPEDRVAAAQRLGALAAGDDVVERRMRRKDGSDIVVEVSVKRLEDGPDFRNRARHHRTPAGELALRESETRYALIEGVRDIVFALGPDGTVTSLNPAFESMTGWTADEWLGETIRATGARGSRAPVRICRARRARRDRAGQPAAPAHPQGRLPHG